jgi:predicted RNase H-like HicB family nuclease
MSPMTVELIPDPEQGGFTAHVPDIPAYGEGETEEEAIADLKDALRAYVEAFGVEDALSRLQGSSALREVEWSLEGMVGGETPASHR